jgi:hypothetical protein
MRRRGAMVAVGPWPRTAAALLVVMIALAPAAAAEDLAPQVDRNSPAGVEYQLPLERAREQAAGGSSTGAKASPLFGEGVEKVQQPARRTPRRERSVARSPAPPPAPAPPAPTIARAQAAPPEDDGGGLLAVGAAGGGVLLVGGLAGLGWRRRAARR